MCNTAFLFPGQGSQHVGMGEDLFDQFPKAREVFEHADDILGFSLSEVMFGSHASPAEAAEALRQTDVTQPALYVHSMAADCVLRGHGLEPQMLAGHSLGEFGALAAAGAISFEDGLALVHLRGRLMAEAGTRRPGTMAAVLGLEDDVVVDLCLQESTSSHSIVEAANFNAPGQIVVSGEREAVERVMQRAVERGARRAVPLPVSGAFHSPLMEHARAGLSNALLELAIARPRHPVYLNVTAEPTQDPDEIRSRALEQLTAPVRWALTLKRMQVDGAGRFVEVGAGNVLSGTVKRTLGRNVETRNAGTSEELRALLGERASPAGFQGPA